jgi:hypothetical protein
VAKSEANSLKLSCAIADDRDFALLTVIAPGQRIGNSVMRLHIMDNGTSVDHFLSEEAVRELFNWLGVQLHKGLR